MNKFGFPKGTSRNRRKPNLHPYMPRGEPSEVLFGVGFTHASDFGIGAGMILLLLDSKGKWRQNDFGTI